MPRKRTQCAIDHEEYMTRRRYTDLSLHPDDQDIEIIRHYANHALLANQLNRLVDIFCSGGIAPSKALTEISEVIRFGADQIRTNHKMDLGLPLEWNEPIKKEDQI